VKTESPFQPFAEEFLNHLRVRGAARRTIEGYRYDLRGFFVFLDEKGIRRLHQVTSQTLLTYHNRLLTRGGPGGKRLTVPSLANHIVHLRNFFRFLSRHHELLINPADDLAVPRCPPRPPTDVPDLNMMKRLLLVPNVRTAKGIRDRAMLELLYSSGLRVSELTGLDLGDVDLEAGELRVRRGKGGKDRVVPVGRAACLWVGRYLRAARPTLNRSAGELALFLSQNGGRWSRRRIAQLMRELVRKAGLKGRITAHTLRHAFATHMLRGKASLRHLQEMLGHVKLSTTQIYTKVDISDLKEVHRRCHPRGRS